MSTFWGTTEVVRSAWTGAEDHCESPSWGRKNILHMVLPPIYQELGLQGVFHRPMCMPGCCDTFVLIHSSLCTGVFRWECCHSHPSQLKLWQFQQMLCWRHPYSPVFPDTLSNIKSNSRIWVCVLCWSSMPLDASHINMVFIHGKWLSLSLVSCLKVRACVSWTLSWGGPSAHFQCGMKGLGV